MGRVSNRRRRAWLLGVPLALLIVGIIAATRSPSTVLNRTTPPRSSATVRNGEAIYIVPTEAYSYTELRVDTLDPVSSFASLQASFKIPDMALLRYVWSVNDQDVKRGPTLEPELFQRGDLVQVRLEGTNQSGKSQIFDRASTVILNSPPVVRSVVLRRSPEDVHVLEAVSDAFDPDGDPLKLTHAWTLSGTPLRDATDASVSLLDVTRGREFVVTVTADDGQARSVAVSSRPFKVTNRAPRLEVGDAELQSEASPNDGDTWASLQVRASDPDGDVVSVDLVDPPADVRWESSSKRIVWRVQEGTDTIRVHLRATDNRGGTVERDLQLSR